MPEGSGNAALSTDTATTNTETSTDSGSPAASGLPGGTPSPGASTGGTPPPSWFGGFPEDVRGYVENKGFKDPLSVVESYRSLEKLQGVPKDRLLKLPDAADQKGWDEVYTKLGKPSDANGYEVTVPEGLSPEFADWAKGTFHELGLTKAQGDKLASKWNERVAASLEQHEAQAATSAQAGESKMKAQWGQAYEQNARVVREFAQASGLTDEQAKSISGAIGVDGLNTFLFNIVQKFGIKTGEHSFAGTGGDSNFSGGILSPAGAKDRIRELTSDADWTKRYLAGGEKEKAEMFRLQSWAQG